MPRVRELVIDGEIVKSIPLAIKKCGGNRGVLTYALQHGETLYFGHRVEYLRKDEPKPEPHIDSPLDRKIRQLCKRKKVKSRPPLLFSRHVTTNFGLYRDQLIYR